MANTKYTEIIPTQSGYLTRALIGGIVGTIPMSLIMYYGPFVGLARWPVPHVLSGMFGAPLAVGWLLHFAIGVVFAFIYLYTFDRIAAIRSDVLRGALYGVIAYLVALASWLIIERMGLVHFSTYYPISYTYLIEHIVFAGCMGIYIPRYSSKSKTITIKTA